MPFGQSRHRGAKNIAPIMMTALTAHGLIPGDRHLPV
jgi:hypothetical protein